MMKTIQTGRKARSAFMFENIYKSQVEFQERLSGKKLPVDDFRQFQYHITGLQEEIGELLKADKRWKTHRNKTYNRDEKLDELSDCFITLLNVAIWSGFSSEEVLDAIENKIKVNNERVDREGNRI